MMPMGSVGIDISQAPTVECDGCGGILFTPAAIVKRISKLQTGALEDQTVTIQVLMCTHCDTVLDSILPGKIKEILDAKENKQDKQGPSIIS